MVICKNKLHPIIVPNTYRNKGRVGYEITFGNTPDIIEYVYFEFYDYYWYWDTPQSYPREKKGLRIWFGVVHNVGQYMVYYTMKSDENVFARRSISPLEPYDYDVNEIRNRMKNLDETIE